MTTRREAPWTVLCEALNRMVGGGRPTPPGCLGATKEAATSYSKDCGLLKERFQWLQTEILPLYEAAVQCPAGVMPHVDAPEWEHLGGREALRVIEDYVNAHPEPPLPAGYLSIDTLANDAERRPAAQVLLHAVDRWLSEFSSQPEWLKTLALLVLGHWHAFPRSRGTIPPLTSRLRVQELKDEMPAPPVGLDVYPWVPGDGWTFRDYARAEKQKIKALPTSGEKRRARAQLDAYLAGAAN